MINPNAKLVEKLFDGELEMKPTRDGYGTGIVLAAKEDERIVVLCADLTESTRNEEFAKKYPERFIELGVAEQNMATVAAGLAQYGKIPFIASYAAFSPGRNNEQIRTTVCINNVPVKIMGCHAGISVGPDGATHQALEDIALMRILPNMTVIVPCDAVEAQKATLALAQAKGPTYLRLGREKSPVMTTAETPFRIGKAEVFRQGRDVAIIGCGMLMHQALLAAEELAKQGIEALVINCHTIKPLDEETIVSAARHCKSVVTVEEHQVAGGLGSAVAELLARNYPVPQEFIGVQDHFGESGTAKELIKAFHLDVSDITDAAKKAIKRK